MSNTDPKSDLWQLVGPAQSVIIQYNTANKDGAVEKVQRGELLDEAIDALAKALDKLGLDPYDLPGSG